MMCAPWGLVTNLFFFFQAEDGIRDRTVTGVQTCALPIWLPRVPGNRTQRRRRMLSQQLSRPLTAVRAAERADPAIPADPPAQLRRRITGTPSDRSHASGREARRFPDRPVRHLRP